MPTRSPTGREVRTLLTVCFLLCALVRGGSGQACGWCAASARNRSATAAPPVGSATDDQHRVVAGDGAEHVVQLRLVDRGRQELRGARRGAEHDEVGRRLGGDQQLAEQPFEPGLGRRRLAGTRRPVAALAGHGVDERPGGGAHLDRVELDEVARQRGLGDVRAPRGRAGRRARSGSAPVAGQQLDDLLLPGALGGRDDGGTDRRSWSSSPPARRSVALLEQPAEQGLLRVQPVLRLVPDHALRSVDAPRRRSPCPGTPGRQCRTIASGFAWPSSSAVTA